MHFRLCSLVPLGIAVAGFAVAHPREGEPKASPPPRALWHWDATPQLRDASARADFLAFCARERIGRLWMQVPPPMPAAAGQEAAVPGPYAFAPQEVPRLKALLAAAHEAGIQVEALDGYPEYALAEHHASPLGLVDAVLQFNAEGRPAERFDGIHLDNEPYLLVGWADPNRRARILRDYLDLAREIHRLAGARLTHGVDIPFWWTSDDLAVESGGKRRSVAEHCLEIFDEVGVMNYRNSAGGPDGMIAMGTPLLALADARPHARVFMGVETFASEPTPVFFVVGLPRPEFEASLGEWAWRSRARGFRLRVLDDGASLHLGLELPAATTDERRREAEAVLAEIAGTLGAASRPERVAAAPRMREAALASLARDREWSGAEVWELVDSRTGRRHPGFRATSIMLPKITFAKSSAEEMRREIALAEEAFARHPSFAGIALHYYDTYRLKVEGR